MRHLKLRAFLKLTITSVMLVILGAANDPSEQFQGDSFKSAIENKAANLYYIHAGVKGFATQDESGKPSGMLVELMSEFEEYLQVKYGIKITSNYSGVPQNSFKTYLNKVGISSGGVFGLSNTSINPERKKKLLFSPAFLNNISVMLSNKSFPTLESMDQISSTFQSKNAYVVPSSVNHKLMIETKNKLFLEMNMIDIPSSKALAEKLAEDPNGYGYLDMYYYLEFVVNQGKPIKRHAVGDRLGDEFGIIMPLDSDWGPVMTEFLNSGFLDTPAYRQMVIDNLGKGALRMLKKEENQ